MRVLVEIERKRGWKMSGAKQKLSDFEIGYVAGIFDGEAHIDCVNKRISVTSTSKDLLQSLQTIVGGTIYLHHNAHTDKAGYNHQKSWRLNIHRVTEIENILSQILPYLKEPKRHDDAIQLRYLNSVKKSRPWLYGRVGRHRIHV